jgi:hypothetical protein
MSNITIKGQTIYGVQPIVTNGLNIYLDAGNINSYPKSGTSWYSIYYNNFISTLFNPIYSSEYGGALVGNGGNNQALLNDINLNADFTYMWVTKKTSNTTPILVGNNFSNSCNMYFQESSIIIEKIGVGTVVDFGATTATNLNIPYMITISLNKATSTFYCYINGVLKNTGVYSTTFQSTNQKLLRRQSPIGLIGSLYLFMGYTKRLSDAEVLQNYNALKGRFGL